MAPQPALQPQNILHEYQSSHKPVSKMYLSAGSSTLESSATDVPPSYQRALHAFESTFSIFTFYMHPWRFLMLSRAQQIQYRVFLSARPPEAFLYSAIPTQCVFGLAWYGLYTEILVCRVIVLLLINLRQLFLEPPLSFSHTDSSSDATRCILYIWCLYSVESDTAM